MTTLAAGSSVTVAVRDGGTVAIATNGGLASAVVTLAEGGTQTVSLGPLTERRTLGPYGEGASVVLTNANCGAFDYDVESTVDPASGAAGTLGRWRAKLATDPANAVMMFIGDSTSDETTSSQYMYLALRGQHVAAGGALYGMTGDASHIVSAGNNGITLANWLADSSKLAAVVAQQPHLIVASFLLNDVRLGQCDLATAKARLTTLVNALRAAVPGADILLRMPNPMLTTNVSSLNYVTSSSGTVNPAGTAQTYSALIRSAYLSMVGQWANVDVIDIQAEVFGTVCRATHPLMSDQLHPSPFSATTGSTTYGGGYVEIANAIANRVGFKSTAFKIDTNQYLTVKEGFTVSASGAGFVDLVASLNVTTGAAAQFPLTTSDVLFIEGFSDPISLSAASIFRPFSTNNIRITGLVTDYTAALGKSVSIGSSHPGPTTGDRQIVSVDLPSIAAGAIGTTTAAVTGARTGALHDATGISCSPPASMVSAGLVLLNCYPSANDTVTLVVLNPTGGAVDLAAANFAFWVIR